MNISKEMFLILRKMIKYRHKENCILRFTVICKINILFGKRKLLTQMGFINELDFRELSFATLKLLHRVLLKY